MVALHNCTGYIEMLLFLFVDRSIQNVEFSRKYHLDSGKKQSSVWWDREWRKGGQSQWIYF